MIAYLRAIERRQKSHQYKVPPLTKWFCLKNWLTGGAGINHWSCLSILPFGVFHVFLRNSRKFGLESLRNTLTEATFSADPGLSCGQLALILQPNPSPHQYKKLNNSLRIKRPFVDWGKFLSIFDGTLISFLQSTANYLSTWDNLFQETHT